MSYLRVIPRDLFNEASLLKCYGKLFICLERIADHKAELIHVSDRDYFQVNQDQSDGSLSLSNVSLRIDGAGHGLMRPLNSREEWPLHLITSDYETIPVFNEDGTLSAEFITLIKG